MHPTSSKKTKRNFRRRFWNCPCRIAEVGKKGGSGGHASPGNKWTNDQNKWWNEGQRKTPGSKKAAKKQLRIQDIEDDVTEMKDNRRQDFMKATTIRDKKRTEASRNSLGKRVK